MKHTETNTVKLKEFVNLRYNNSRGGIFRLAKGRSPLVVVDVVQHEEIILIECLYLTSGAKRIHTGDKEVVPLKLGTFKPADKPEVAIGGYYNETYY